MPVQPVHPHGCGERNISIRIVSITFGSSPRLWGTQPSYGVLFCVLRFIPTAVGNAGSITLIARTTAVHPHGCGERETANRDTLLAAGSSPRLWGTLRCQTVTPNRFRFIPTAVGNASLLKGASIKSAVHPHGCGERGHAEILGDHVHGSSPRLWGTRTD